MTNPHRGSSFDEFLQEEKLLTEVETAAVKHILAYQIAELMRLKNFSKTKMANEMRTSRAAVDRLLDPDNTSVTLSTVVKAAHVLGKRLSFSLVDCE